MSRSISLTPIPAPRMLSVVYEAAEESKKKKGKLKEKPKRDGPSGSGVDDGKSAQKLLMGYVDQVLEQVASPDAREIPSHITAAKSFKESSFLERLNHKDLVDIPLHSQITRQKAMEPTHETTKMNLFIGVCDSLKRNDGGMVRARLSGEMIDDKVAKMLANALPNNVYLQHLMLHDNFITDIGLEALCTALHWHPSIQTIWMAGNLISDRGAIALATLCGRNHNVIDLNLANKRPRKTWTESEGIVHPEIGPLGCEAFAKQLSRGCGLTSLSLAEHKIRDMGARMLFKALKSSHLRALNLKSTGITSNCCSSLCTALQGQPVLEKLILSKNEICDDGVIDLCNGLAQNAILQALDLSYCQINDQGMNALLEVLEKNSVLSVLNTMYNPCTDDRADRIVEMRNAATTALDRHLDRLGPDGIHAAPLSTETMETLHKIAKDSFKIGYLADGGEVDHRDGKVPLGAIAMPHRAKEVLVRTSSRGASRGRSRTSSRQDISRSLSPRQLSRDEGDALSVHLDDPWIDQLDTPPGGLDLTTGWREVSGRKTPKILSVSVGGMRPLSRPLRTANSSRGNDGSTTIDRSLSSGGQGRGLSSAGFSARPLTSQSMSLARGEPCGDPSGGSDMAAFLELFESQHDALQRTDSSKDKRKEFVITEEMRLGHLLPKSPYRRYFEETNRPTLSRELGMTRGVPTIPNVGVMPVRNTVSRFKDSAQHLTYLRIATPDDPPEARPISLIRIALDQKAYADKIRAERQLPLYKQLKRDATDLVPRKKTRAMDKKIPDVFWEKWKKKMRQRYPRGIDKATKVTSIDLKEFKRPTTVRSDGKVVLDKVKAQVKTPGQALVWRREQRAKELEAEKAKFDSTGSNETIARAKKLTHDILGLRADQPMSDLYSHRPDREDVGYRKGLTVRTGQQEAPIVLISKEFKAY